MKKKILIHSMVFSPDGVSTAYLYNDIALAFQRADYQVVVLTTTPHFNKVEAQLKKQPLKWKVWGLYKESNFNGIRILHVPQKKFKSTFLRLLGFVYWHFVSFLLALFQKNVDVILSPSPPLTIGVINRWLAKLKRCKVVYNVQEIYPDILKKCDGLVLSLLKQMERYVYNRSDAVTTIDKVFYNVIAPRFENREKLHIIPNFVDTELYKPNIETCGHLDEKLFPNTTSLKLLYAGNIGFAQDWDPLLALAERTRDANIEYFVIGEGIKRDFLARQKESLGLEKLHVVPYQPRELMPQILQYSDVQFIFMDPAVDMHGFPSKVYTIMACAKPLLVCSSAGTPIVNFLENHNCAKLITEGNFDAKVEEMEAWLRQVSREELHALGREGVRVIEDMYSKEVVVRKYVALVDQLISNTRS